RFTRRTRSMPANPAPPTVALIGAPSDAGGNVRGATLGPAALRLAGLAAELAALGVVPNDRGDVDPARILANEKPFSLPGGRNATQVAAWARASFDATLAALRDGELPLLMGGDHSLAMGSVAAAATFARSQER